MLQHLLCSCKNNIIIFRKVGYKWSEEHICLVSISSSSSSPAQRSGGREGAQELSREIDAEGHQLTTFFIHRPLKTNFDYTNLYVEL